MEWILVPIFAVILTMAGFVFWLGRRLVSDVQSTAGGAYFVPLESSVAEVMLNVLELKPAELLCDVGCGDARHLITAAQKYQTRGRGVEIAVVPYSHAIGNLKAAGLTHQIQLIRGDIDAISLMDVDAVFLYLNGSLLARVANKIKRECRAGTRIVCARYPLPDTTPVQTFPSRYPVYLYKI